MKKQKCIEVDDMRFQVIFRQEPEGGFTVLVPALPGCITYGKNLSHARKMAEEAITLYLEDMTAEGERLPEHNNAYISEISIRIPARIHSLVHA